ncbi:MAG: undecaprenyl diphosphate synthase family protein, partial [Evtepia sp.]|nr:undecaprenyl diphosphate synthase family protein [Evtepia sp.]
MKKRFAALCLTCSALLSLSAPAAAVRAPNDSRQPQSSTGNTSVTIPSDGTLSFDQIGPRVKANNLTLKAAQESLKSAEAMDWDEAIDEMERDHIRLKILGELGPLSPELRALIERTDEISTHYQGFQANVCINYGGRDELVHAARRFAADCVHGVKKPEELTEADFAHYLYT